MTLGSESLQCRSRNEQRLRSPVQTAGGAQRPLGRACGHQLAASGCFLGPSYSSGASCLSLIFVKLTAKQQPSTRGSNTSSPPKLRKMARETYNPNPVASAPC